MLLTYLVGLSRIQLKLIIFIYLTAFNKIILLIEINAMELTCFKFNSSSKKALLLLKQIIYNIVGYPKDQPLQSTIEALSVFEKRTKWFRCLNYGFVQSKQAKSSVKFDYISWAIRVTAVISIIRGLALASTNNSWYHLILGDPLFGTNVLPYASLFITIWLINIYIIFEWFRWAERSGSLFMLYDFHQCRLDNFNSLQNELTASSFATFRTLTHIISIFFSRFLVWGIFMITLLINGPLLSNPFYYHNYVFTITSSLWSISLTFPMVYLFNCISCIGGYFILISLLMLVRYKSLVKKGSIVKVTASNANVDISYLVSRTISLGNETDALSRSLKYLILHYIMFISMVGDLGIFFGIIAPTESILIRYILSSLGFL
uniref:Gustatory receptor n=1 Tax=Tetranychus urticae TaxID=32264 RepID=T1L6I9_TETUR